MREARALGGLEPDGERLVTYRSPGGLRLKQDPEMSFDEWKDTDELPAYEDHVNGFDLDPPLDNRDEDNTTSMEGSGPQYQPDHPDFGGKSCVNVPVPGEILDKMPNGDKSNEAGAVTDMSQATSKVKESKKASKSVPKKPVRRPVNQRWFYEPVASIEQDSSGGNNTTVEVSDSSLCRIDRPEHLGALKDLAQDDLDNIKDDESGACYLHGTIFLDSELG